jgi:hypothetical protein
MHALFIIKVCACACAIHVSVMHSKSNHQPKTHEIRYPRSLRTRNQTRKPWHPHPHAETHTPVHTCTHPHALRRIHKNPKQHNHILILSPEPTCKPMHTFFSAQNFPCKKQISSVEMWKFRIEKHMVVHAGRCMRTMSRPRHVRRRQHNTSGPNISHAQASPLARHPLDAHTPRDARSWWPHQQHGIFVLGAHSYKQTINQGGDRQRRSELPYTSRHEHKKMLRTVVLRGPSPLVMSLDFFWKIPLRDSNCSGIQHSENVVKKKCFHGVAKALWLRMAHKKKKDHPLSSKTSERKGGERCSWEKSRQCIAKQDASSFVSEIN